MKKIATILAVCIITAIASNWMVGNYKKQQEMRMWYERMQSVSVSLNEEKENETQITPIDTQMPQRTSPRTQPEPNPSFSTATSEKLNPSRTTDENAMMREAQRIYDDKCEELDDAKRKYEVEVAKMDLLTARYNAGEISHEEYFASLTEFFDGPFAEYFATLTEFFDGPFAQYFAMRKDLFNSIK